MEIILPNVDQAGNFQSPKVLGRLDERFTRRGDLLVSVRDHGAKGDGTTDDTAAVSGAVAAVTAAGAELYWPAGTYLTTASIPGLHTVRHAGPGAIKAGSGTFNPAPVGGQVNTLYVSPTGDDSNDGLVATRAFREIRAAVAALEVYGPELHGQWRILVAAGIYKGGIRTPVWRAPGQEDYLRILGPAVGHPNTPSAVIDKTADPTATYGVLAENGAWLWLQDLHVKGAFGNAVDIRRDSYLLRRNLHISGGSAVGVSLTTRAKDQSQGGIIDGCTSYGIQAMTYPHHDYQQAGSIANGTIIRNCKVGLMSKAGGTGHLDYLTLEGNTVGLQLDRSSANVGNVTFKRNGTAIVLKDGEIHSEAGVVWGAGADANTRRVVSYGPASSESSLWGWASDDAGAQLRTGLRPPILIGGRYNSVTVTGATAPTLVHDFGTILPAARYAIQGTRVRVIAYGTTDKALAGAVGVRVLIAGQAVGRIDLPAGTAAGTHFSFEFTMICDKDGDTQKNVMTLNGLTAPIVRMVPSTRDLTTGDRSLRFDLAPANAEDSVSIHLCEVYG